MAGTYEINHKGKTIYCVDLAGLQLKDKAVFQNCLEEAKAHIRRHPPKSMTILTNVSDTGFDTEFVNEMKAYVANNTPYVKASAVVGVTGWQKVILIAIKSLTGRDFYLANSIDEAKEWLVQQ